MPTHRPAEFDAFAPGYDAGMSDPVKRIVGGSADTFLEHKADWLLRNVPVSGRLLDFGCGTGGFLRALRRRGAPAELVGCDVASGMIEEARRRWDGGPPPDLRSRGAGIAAIRRCRVRPGDRGLRAAPRAPAEQPAIARELLRVVRPGGAVVDLRAQPAQPDHALDGGARAHRRQCGAAAVRGVRPSAATGGRAECRTDYILFFPPSIGPLRQVERLLGRVPLGGQYATVGTRAR